MPALSPARIGIIGGSGVYGLEGLNDIQSVAIDTPWGAPSDELLLGTLDGIPVAFLPRHGRGHRVTPSEVPYHANIYALRSLGVQRVLSVSAVGSLCHEYAPGDFVMVDQFIDRTLRRGATFFGDGIIAHVPLADPVCAEMAAAVMRSGSDLPVKIFSGGAYVCIEGPQFSTRAESELYRSWGAKIVGMTNATEARLAREAGMSFACIAMVTDFDCWHPEHDDVDVAAVVATAKQNASAVRELVTRSIPVLDALGPSPWRGVLDSAVMTAHDCITTAAIERTAALFSD